MNRKYKIILFPVGNFFFILQKTFLCSGFEFWMKFGSVWCIKKGSWFLAVVLHLNILTQSYGISWLQRNVCECFSAVGDIPRNFSVKETMHAPVFCVPNRLNFRFNFALCCGFTYYLLLWIQNRVPFLASLFVACIRWNITENRSTQ